VIGQPAAVEHVGSAGGSVEAPDEDVVGVVSAGVHEPLEHEVMDVEVPTENDRPRDRPDKRAASGTLSVPE
jgi:hypothetical protein